MSRSLDDLLTQLARRLQEPLPGHEAHLTMAPRDPSRTTALSIQGKDCREAAVLLCLAQHDGRPSVLLTVRRAHLPDHGGQISFPGGRREGTESLSETALREADEEIGLSPSSTKILGTLTPLYIPPSNFCVHPFVGAATSELTLSPTDQEVETILRVPLTHLLDPATRVQETWILQGTELEVPYYSVEDHKVWGATAMMLAEGLAVIRELQPNP